jgi:hypothetical protein
MLPMSILAVLTFASSGSGLTALPRGPTGPRASARPGAGFLA